MMIDDEEPMNDAVSKKSHGFIFESIKRHDGQG